jgi:hypothetical protein
MSPESTEGFAAAGIIILMQKENKSSNDRSFLA